MEPYPNAQTRHAMEELETQERDELAALELTELHPLPQTVERQDSGLASSKSGLAALRDFDAAFDRSGSGAPDSVSDHVAVQTLLRPEVTQTGRKFAEALCADVTQR